MEHISAEEFLKQPKEVQEMFIAWWKPSDGDIFWWNKDKCIDCCYHMSFMDNEDINNLKEDKEIIQLFTEGQLRKFIEDKMECKISSNIGEYGYQISLYKFKESKDEEHHCEYYREYEPTELNTTDLLQAYWKVACQIAKEV